MTPKEKFLRNFPNEDRNRNSWQVCCPAHDDRSPSLSIKEKSDGTLLINCFAGCEPGEVCAALGLELCDLYPSKKPTKELPPLKLKKQPAKAKRAVNKEEACLRAEDDRRNAEFCAINDLVLPTFPTSALPKALQDFVEAETHATQTPADLAGLLSLAVCSASIAGKVEVSPRDGFIEPVNLYVAALLEPGCRKSQVFKDATQPLREVEEDEIEAAKPNIARKQSERRQLEARLKKLEKQAIDKGDLAAKRDAEDLAAKLAMQPEIVLPRRIVDDITPEKLEVVLSQQGGRIASMSAEGGVFDLIGGRYSTNGAPNFDVYLKGHAADDINTARLGRPDIRVKKPAITCAYAIQPVVIGQIAKNPVFRGRGLLARFLYAFPENMLGERQIAPTPVPAAVRDAYHQLVRRLAEFRGDVLLKLSEKAARKFTQWEAEIESMLNIGGMLETIQDWGAKLAGQTLRIAGVLHCVEYAPSGTIKEATITAAIRISKYLIPHAQAVLTQMNSGGRTVDSDARYLLRWIKRHKLHEFSKRDAHQHCKRRFPFADDLDPVLAELEARLYIRLRPAEAKGPGRRASPMYDVHPAFFNGETD